MALAAVRRYGGQDAGSGSRHRAGQLRRFGSGIRPARSRVYLWTEPPQRGDHAGAVQDDRVFAVPATGGVAAGARRGNRPWPGSASSPPRRMDSPARRGTAL